MAPNSSELSVYQCRHKIVAYLFSIFDPYERFSVHKSTSIIFDDMISITILILNHVFGCGYG